MAYILQTVISLLLISNLLVIDAQVNDKVYFPGPNNYDQYVNNYRAPNTSIRQEVGLSSWENHVNNVIYKGILSLTKAFDEEIKRIVPVQGIGNNVILSPVCISEILALLLLGSNGITKREIANVLGLATGINFEQHTSLVHQEFGRLLQLLETSYNGVKSTTASAIFVQNGYQINQEYKKSITNVYHSEIQNLNFQTDTAQAQQVINSWVNSKTFGKIRSILDNPLNPNVKVVLATTLYFHGEWEIPFPSTVRRPFYPDGVDSSNNVFVTMMGNNGYYLYHKDNDLNCEIIRIPYKDNLTAFYAIKPFKTSDKQTLQQLKHNLTPENIERLLSQVKEKQVLLFVPKMVLTQTISLKQVLQNLHVQSLFDQRTANLSNMFSYNQYNLRDNLFVGDVLHKVQIDVNKLGTTGSASTAAYFAKTFKIFLNLNTPFLFFIRHEPTKLNLFWGSIEVPTPNYPREDSPEYE